MGGLDLCNPKELAHEEYRNSHSATGPLVRAISEQKEDRCMSAQLKLQTSGMISKHRKESIRRKSMHYAGSSLKQHEARCGLSKGEGSLQLAQCSSNWGVWFLSTFTAFRDAVALRYGWQLPNLPSVCVSVART